MNAYRSVSLACVLAVAWLVGCDGQPDPGVAPLQTTAGAHTHDDAAPRTMLIAITTDDPPVVTEPISRLDSGARGEGIRPTRGASGLQP
ncbi:hypothetical protein BURC_03379 [Burkholderiaceae bacterium]|nr:hypothetical protein BURC_03379 [Burkholderiaceae bacterium]